MLRIILTLKVEVKGCIHNYLDMAQLQLKFLCIKL